MVGTSNPDEKKICQVEAPADGKPRAFKVGSWQRGPVVNSWNLPAKQIA